MGTFAFPAYATFDDAGNGPDGLAEGHVASATEFSSATTADAQTLQASEATASENVAVEALSSTSNSTDDEAQAADAAKEAEEAAEKKAAEEAAAAQEAQTEQVSNEAPAEEPAGEDIPSGEGAGAIVDAAKAQLGVAQDCTALVEKSLRAAGIPAGDLGTQVGEYTALGGKQVSTGSMAPGDILVWPGSHVAVYIGNGQAVHGGWNGGTTAIGPISGGTMGGGPGAVVRF